MSDQAHAALSDQAHAESGERAAESRRLSDFDPLIISNFFDARACGELIGELREVGTFVAFRSETAHEVTALTRGERYSIVGWHA